MIPSLILAIWLTGLLSLSMLAASIALAHEWYQRSWGWDQVLNQSVFDPQFGWNAATALLVSALALALVSFLGKFLVKLFFKLFRSKNGNDDPEAGIPAPNVEEFLKRPDGSKIRVRIYGAESAPPLVLTHGWGMHSDAWNYAKRDLSRRFRVITWDEPGLGASAPPEDRNYHLERLAEDLEAVLAKHAQSQPALLVGHSIGGMITLTFCKLFPEALGSRVAGLVLVHTTYTNPVRTTAGAPLLTALESVLLKPLMYLTIALSPLVWLMNIMSYLNGSGHLMTALTGFAGTESWKQVDFAARFQTQANPGVLARGMLGMMKYDATLVLPTIHVPVLVVSGNKDIVCKPEASDRMERDIPGAQRLNLTPAKHLGMIEHHETFGAAVDNFATLSQRSVQ